MAIIPIKLNDTEVSKIDYLVKIGKFKSRNQAIKHFIHKNLELESIILDDELKSEEEIQRINKIKKELFEHWKSLPEFVLCGKGGKSLVDQVSEGRDRFQ